MSTFDDVEPYKSAVPCNMTSFITYEFPINYPNPHLRVKVLLFVGPKYYHEISGCGNGLIKKVYYRPYKKPVIPLNSLIEVCGTLQDFKNFNDIESEDFTTNIVHRIITTDIYHNTPHKNITNPPRREEKEGEQQEQSTTTINNNNNNKQWTVDDVMLALNKHWNAARQYYTQAKLTHKEKDAYICHYDAIPYTDPNSVNGFHSAGPEALWGTLAIISSMSTIALNGTTVNIIIPTPSQDKYVQDNKEFHRFGLRCDTVRARTDDLITLPTTGSLCLIYMDGDRNYIGHLPLLLPPPPSPSSSLALPSSWAPLAREFFSSTFTTNPTHNALLHRLVVHHNKLCNNMVNKDSQYTRRTPLREECIDIAVYLDIAALTPEKLAQELADEAKRKEAQEEKKRREEQYEQYQQHLQQLQVDKTFILQQLQYHNDVIIAQTLQKLEDQRQHQHNQQQVLFTVLSSEYITTHITTPFQQLQQRLRDYLEQNYTLSSSSSTTTQYNIGNPQPSPLESYEYNAYCNDFQDIQTTLCALSSATTLTTASLIESTLNNNNNNTTNNNAITNTTNISHKNNDILLELQPPHIYHHAHPCMSERARTAQKLYQHVLQTTAILTTSKPESTSSPPPLPQVSSPSQWSSLNPSLHEMVLSCEASLRGVVDDKIKTDNSNNDNNGDEIGMIDQNNVSKTTQVTEATLSSPQSTLFDNNNYYNNQACHYLINQFERREQQLLRENEAWRTRELQYQEELKSKDEQLKTKDEQLKTKDEQLKTKDAQILAYQQRQHDDHNQLHQQLAALQQQMMSLQQHILQNNNNALNNTMNNTMSDTHHNNTHTSPNPPPETQPRLAAKRDNSHLPDHHQHIGKTAQDGGKDCNDHSDDHHSSAPTASSLGSPLSPPAGTITYIVTSKRHKPNNESSSDDDEL